MVLAQLQSLLQDIYGLETPYEVGDFVTTDEDLVEALDVDGRRVDEKLLISEQCGGEAEVSLYLQEALMQRLDRDNPAKRLGHHNLADFWTAFEGVSHFTYYVWNAALGKQVTLMEMELQAEVDKFVGTALLLMQQGGRLPVRLHRWLFDLPKFDSRLSVAELTRYRDANRYAGKYCLKLAPRLSDGASSDWAEELRRFYRLSQPAKIRHIEMQ
jgi:hypothetical protein